MSYASRTWTKDLLGKTLKSAKDQGLLGGEEKDEIVVSSEEPTGDDKPKFWLDPAAAAIQTSNNDTNPVGTIISFMGSKAPTGYFKCDGSTYNIADYPIFAAYLMEQFESYSYFGGDGETTFAVPDLRGEFLRGTGDNSHIDATLNNNCGSGSDVGTHQDPTKEYSSYNDGCYHSIQLGADQSLYVQDIDGYVLVSSNSSYSSKAAANTQNFYHYSSRPTNTSVLYCIKY